MKGIPSIFFAVLGMLAAGVFALTLVHAVLYAPELDVYLPAGMASSTSVVKAVTPDMQPARLLIPSLHIDAAIQYVGVNAKGSMGVPSNFKDVAWYKYGTVPGQKGSAVIDGHVDNGLSLAGVFKHLIDIKQGADVYVLTKNGTKLHFVVRTIASYNYRNVPLELVFQRNESSYLNLVTCEGNWIKGEKTYDQRLIVYTQLVP